MTPLMQAAWRGDTVALRTYLKPREIRKQVKPHNSARALLAFMAWMQELPDRNPGWTALHFAVDSSRHDAARLLLAAGADPSGSADAMKPLDIAVFRRDRAMLLLLLQHGANAAPSDNYLQTPLAYAAAANDTALIRLLLRNGAPVDHGEKGSGRTPLMAAAETGAADAVAVLLAADADPALHDRNGWTALRYALKNKHDDIGGMLGGLATPQAADQHLFDAIASGDEQGFRKALADGANPNAVQEQGRSALMEAVGNLSEAAVFELIDRGARFDADDRSALLFVSIVRGHHKLFDRLIDLGEKPRDNSIAVAVRANQREMVERLLDMGLDPNAQDVTQRTAIELAETRGDTAMLRLLKAPR